MDDKLLSQLIEKYLSGVLTEPEFELLKENRDDPRIEEILHQPLQKVFTSVSVPKPLSSHDEAMLEQIFTAGKQIAPVVELNNKVSRRPRLLIPAAAVAILFISGAVYFFFNRNSSIESLTGKPQAERFRNDISPAFEGVSLTTSDNKTIRLDSTNANSIITDGSVLVNNKNGTLSYNAYSDNDVFYHTITTNKGKSYQLILNDGTKVWIDAQSSIYYPTKFTGQDRVVTITGQAYFEVAKDATKPFKVRCGQELIEVLGTHFNVNMHKSEVVEATLLEGSIRIRSIILKPGQQALDQQGQVNIKDAVNIEQITAWKNDQFYFDGSTIQDIMSELERWYDIQVKYEGKVTEEFVADIPRKLPLSRLLNLLEKTKQVEFIIDGNIITVIPKK